MKRDPAKSEEGRVTRDAIVERALTSVQGSIQKSLFIYSLKDLRDINFQEHALHLLQAERIHGESNQNHNVIKS